MPDSLRQAGASDSTAKVVELPRPILTHRTGEGRVERINQFDFYSLARKLDPLHRVPAEGAIDHTETFWAAYWGQQYATALLGGDPIELGVSRAKAELLLSNINALIQRRFTSYDDEERPQWRFPQEGDEPMYAWEWSHIRSALADFEVVFAEELREAATYRVPNRGIYNTRKLVDEAECAFPREIEAHIPEKTKLEWRAAGRCLAFGMFTACGFHVARGVEGTLEAYFEFFNRGSDKRLKQWGQYLDALERVVEAGAAPMPDAKTLGELKQLKDDWRNPLMHPRVALEEPDAHAVFNNGATLIIMMAQELSRAEREGVVQPGLALVPQSGDAA